MLCGSIKTENSSRYGPIELIKSTSGWPLSTIPSMYMSERMIGKASSPKAVSYTHLTLPTKA